MTRSLLFLVTLLTFNFKVLAYPFLCTQKEAQFSGGIISEIRTEKVDQGLYNCHIKIKSFQNFQNSQVCPLDVSEAYNVDILVANTRCENRFQVGASISGYLVLTQEGTLIVED